VRRLFWVALGATAGVLVFRAVSRTAAAYTPAGVGRSISSAGRSLRDLADAVRDGMDEREQELRAALGADAGPSENPSASGRHR
jgi:predicted small secreted protein